MNDVHTPVVNLIRSVAHSLWSLARPAHFESIRPTVNGVHYRGESRRGIAPLADVYVAPSNETGASVIIVHGGAFVIGRREMKPVRFLAARLVEAGITVCAVDYRMIFRGGRLDEAVDDVSEAVAWWMRTAPQYGADPARCSALGISAGGALTMLAARDDRGAGLHRLVGVFGLYDFSDLEGTIGAVLPRLLLRSSDRASWQRRSPMAQTPVPQDLLLIHGGRDGLVPVQQARALEARRAAAGRHTETMVFDDQPHAFLNWAGEPAEQSARAIAGWVR